MFHRKVALVIVDTFAKVRSHLLNPRPRKQPPKQRRVCSKARKWNNCDIRKIDVSGYYQFRFQPLDRDSIYYPRGNSTKFKNNIADLEVILDVSIDFDPSTKYNKVDLYEPEYFPYFANYDVVYKFSYVL